MERGAELQCSKPSHTRTLPEPHASVISSNPVSLQSTSILTSTLSLPLQHYLFKSCFATKVLYMPCPACRPWLDRPNNTGWKRNKNSFSCRLRIPHGCNETRAEQLPVKCGEMQQTRFSTFLLPSILRLMTCVIQAYPPHPSSGVSPYKMIDEIIIIIIMLIKLLFPCNHGSNPSFSTVGRKVTYISWNKKSHNFRCSLSLALTHPGFLSRVRALYSWLSCNCNKWTRYTRVACFNNLRYPELSDKLIFNISYHDIRERRYTMSTLHVPTIIIDDNSWKTKAYLNLAV